MAFKYKISIVKNNLNILIIKSAILFFSLMLVMLGCNHSDQKQLFVPLYDDLSHYHRKVNTVSDKAQEYFDQGLTLYYGFNHEAAILSFRQAIALDSNCAMAWWGQAISAGPNINNPVMDSSAKITAWQTVVKAMNHIQNASPVEKSLIHALSKRYTWPPPDDRKPLDTAYAQAMRDVYIAFPEDPDVGVLFADAMLNLRPWDQWTPEGIANPGTEEIVATLEKVLKTQPDHPGGCHFYVHSMEASPEPGKALQAADNLRNRIPGAGHLVHMPSHIDIRLGHYEDAIKANQKAIIADSVWVQSGGFYTIYRAHNYHFLAYAAMFEGQKKLALNASHSLIEQIPLELVRAFPDNLDAFYAIPTHVMVRFGLWDELLAQPKPPEDLYLTTAFWHYGRAVALASLGRIPEAEIENDSLQRAYEMVPASRLVGNNSGTTVLDIGLLMAQGELEYRKGNFTEAFDLLRKAVIKDDSLRYDEPWGWMMPVRHALGALLVEQGLYDEAEKVYTKDLALHPDNGWALKGLSTCYHQTGRHQLASNTDARFTEAWSRSDISLKTSCFCSKGNEL
jgi:tetratricopeptide (TPR) repeat protein